MAQVKDASLKPLGYVKVGGIDTATGLTVPAGARYVMCKVETQAARYRDDGTLPTATDGMLIDVGDELWYAGNLNAVKFISATAGSILHVAFYR